MRLTIRRASTARMWKASTIEVVARPFSLFGVIGRVAVKRKDAVFEVRGTRTAMPLFIETTIAGRRPACSCPNGPAPRSTKTIAPEGCFMCDVCASIDQSPKMTHLPTKPTLLAVVSRGLRAGRNVPVHFAHIPVPTN